MKGLLTDSEKKEFKVTQKRKDSVKFPERVFSFERELCLWNNTSLGSLAAEH